jgi:hypothetical protein
MFLAGSETPMQDMALISLAERLRQTGQQIKWLRYQKQLDHEVISTSRRAIAQSHPLLARPMFAPPRI